ncbi:hypothetical protein L596_006217 [Steinernema carpocapsae]|uniref:Uncharacterized protein n=1 Tax=Steinernema carpocapsae TaxID=34508 RepID=A0A4U8V1F0_STECR|nr:hypothetical protein L596_006217 [Steinernema carpocapsae]
MNGRGESWVQFEGNSVHLCASAKVIAVCSRRCCVFACLERRQTIFACSILPVFLTTHTRRLSIFLNLPVISVTEDLHFDPCCGCRFEAANLNSFAFPAFLVKSVFLSTLTTFDCPSYRKKPANLTCNCLSWNLLISAQFQYVQRLNPSRLKTSQL